MKYLEAIAKIPLPRLILFVLTLIVFLVAMENLPWAQKVAEYLLGMETASVGAVEGAGR